MPVIDVDLSKELSDSYVDYSMSVLTDRAVPDVRDGLKPVERRILYDMQDMGLYHDKPYKKSARVAGDVMGRLHPHSDSYGTIVVMSQEFKKMLPLIDGHGNFGSISGDPAAAMRYTECRLQKAAEDIYLSDLSNQIVDFSPTYDDTWEEPIVLPCKVPGVLVNGCEGIAVGMTTSIPPHNLGNLVDAVIYYIDNPKASAKMLLNHLKGPDFPTGGIISNSNELESMYNTGKGKIKIRGRFEFEKGNSKEKDKLVVTEIPYTMIGEGINNFLVDVSKLVEDKILPEICDIRDESANKQIRIVFELKPNTDTERIKNIIYKKTKLEDTIGVNMLVVHDKKPEVMGLKSILDAYLQFQKDVYIRKFNVLRDKAQKRKEIAEGLIKAIDLIDIIVEVLKGSSNAIQAKNCLTSGIIEGIKFKTKTAEKEATKLRFTDAQASAILEMKLSRLIKLELSSLEKELSDLNSSIEEYTKILSDESEMKKEMKKTLRAIKKEFGIPRKTSIENLEETVIEKNMDLDEPEQNITVVIDNKNYIHSIDIDTTKRNLNKIVTDFAYFAINVSNKHKIAIFTNLGTVYLINVKDIPFEGLRDKGKILDSFTEFNSDKEKVVGLFSVSNSDEELVFVSSDGKIKRTYIKEFNISRQKTDATKLNANAKLLSVFEFKGDGEITLINSNNTAIRLHQSDIKNKGRIATGTNAEILPVGVKIIEASTREFNIEFSKLGYTPKKLK